MKSKPTVSVVMITYKHEKYIEDAINGVLMQECDFKVELIIADDCSPDDTQTIVNRIKNEHKNGKWIKYTKHSQNIGMIPNFNWALNQTKGKFIAICDGDDYWTNSLKLQKQVDLLEENIEIGLVHTQISLLNIKNNNIKVSTKKRSLTSFEDLLHNNCIVTSTVCFRKNLYLNYLKDINPLEKKWVSGDAHLWLWFTVHSKMQYIDESMVVYRIISGSASNTNSSRQYLNFIQSRLNIKRYFIDKYGAPDEIHKFVIHDFYKDAEYHALKLKEKGIIKSIASHRKNENRFLKSFYFNLMSNLVNNKSIYLGFFFMYKAFYRIKRVLKRY